MSLRSLKQRMGTPFAQHQRKWIDCIRCPLHEQRQHVVLCRGRERGKINLPIDVLYVGEAPGVSEDVLGSPFVGPAGQLLDEIIEYSEQMSEVHPTIGFTNLVACIPKDGHGMKTVEPPKEAIAACRLRLVEFVQLARPKVIVLVGKLAAMHCPGQSTHSIGGRKLRFVEIVHPAAILKSKDPAQRSLAIQRTAVTLQDMLEFL